MSSEDASNGYDWAHTLVIEHSKCCAAMLTAEGLSRHFSRLCDSACSARLFTDEFTSTQWTIYIPIVRVAHLLQHDFINSDVPASSESSTHEDIEHTKSHRS